MKDFKDFKDKITNVRKEAIYNYSYEYWRGTDNKLFKNELANLTFGDTREGYEAYKRENPDSYIDIADTYLRKVKDKVSGRTIGYITEKKLDNIPHITNAGQIYKDALNYVRETLDVQDESSFMFYIYHNVEINDMRKGIDTYYHQIENLEKLLEDYNEDEEFRKFFDKIIKV
jgi:hypothetical protein